MKTALKFVVLGGLLIGFVNVSQAERVHAWISVRAFPLVVVRPVPVAQPVVVADPYAAPPLDYNQVLADFHNRVTRLQRVLDRELTRHIIGQVQYDRHAADLDAILRDEQHDAALHNGGLTPREVHELNQRLTLLQDRVHEDIAR